MTNLVGVLRENGKDGLVELDRRDQEIGNQIIIPRKFLNGAPFNMKVVVEYKGLSVSGQPLGEIVEVLGEEGSADAAILSIVRFYNLSEKFPDEVQAEAESFGHKLTQAEVNRELDLGRRDLRDLNTVTIDGEDAKDLDDAIDIERLENGDYRLYVHIADVSHYVKPGSALDKEAQKRGNSVYLVDRVIPMYPAQLSNGICSLNPGQDRFAFTAEMQVDNRGEIVQGALYPSIIQSKVRSSYNEVQAIIDGSPVDPDRPDWFANRVFLMRELTDVLQAMRKRRGALEFEFPETKVELDKTGKPVRIYAEPDLYANHIIESFMIAANEFTANLAVKHKIPVLYRVHELPDREKLENFLKLARSLNFKVRISDQASPKELADALERMKGQDYGQTLSAILLRSLAKARYTEKNLGHFGLASPEYCHFTAPIRRYSDSFSHRKLKDWLRDKQKFSKREFSQAHDLGDHVSETERLAIDAERDTVDQKAAEYYAERIGEIYPGRISGFSPANIFVQLETSVEGAIFFRSLDGYYEYDPDRLIAIHKDSGQILRIGQKMVVQIAAVDVNRRFIDLHLIEHETAQAIGTPSKKSRPSKFKRTQSKAKQEAKRTRDRGQGSGRQGKRSKGQSWTKSKSAKAKRKSAKKHKTSGTGSVRSFKSKKQGPKKKNDNRGKRR